LNGGREILQRCRPVLLIEAFHGDPEL
jgi:hypothetical protein